MGWEKYVFAVFLFGLLCLLAFMVVRALRKNDAKDSLAKMEKEERMLALYARMDEMLDAAEAYIEESKQEIAAQLDRAQELVQEMERRNSFEVIIPEAAPPAPPPQDEPERAEAKAELTERVLELDRQGYSIDQIAETLSYSKGEIRFILRMNRKQAAQQEEQAQSENMEK